MTAHLAPAGSKSEPQAVPDSELLAQRQPIMAPPMPLAAPALDDEKPLPPVADLAEEGPMSPLSPLPRALVKAEDTPEEQDVDEERCEIEEIVATHTRLPMVRVRWKDHHPIDDHWVAYQNVSEESIIAYFHPAPVPPPTGGPVPDSHRVYKTLEEVMSPTMELLDNNRVLSGDARCRSCKKRYPEYDCVRSLRYRSTRAGTPPCNACLIGGETCSVSGTRRATAPTAPRSRGAPPPALSSSIVPVIYAPPPVLPLATNTHAPAPVRTPAVPPPSQDLASSSSSTAPPRPPSLTTASASSTIRMSTPAAGLAIAWPSSSSAHPVSRPLPGGFPASASEVRGPSALTEYCTGQMSDTSAGPPSLSPARILAIEHRTHDSEGRLAHLEERVAFFEHFMAEMRRGP
ncbi:unnamed protein product [Peniophora sp. CBMAI 1063]|nr:unnamed protein product [Peniophora sp. CBMAI 1063]